MTPTQRRAALRLADALTGVGFVANDLNLAAALLRELAASPQGEPVACLIGARGSAFDLPTTKRAYTYAEQPGNVVASKLGAACTTAGSQSAGDSIDRGLVLLRELQKQGFGVFNLGAEYAAPQQPMRCPTDGGECGAGGYCRPEPVQRRPLSDEQINRLDTEAIHGGPDSQYAFRFARAVEKAHSITGEQE